MRPTVITSKDDARVAHYFMLRERDLVGRDGLFIAEGEVVLHHLVRSSLMETLSVFILEKRFEDLEADLSLLPADVPVYTGSQAVMDAIVGFHIHRGILAVGRRRKLATPDELLSSLPPRALVLGLVDIANHDNMGGLFRNAAAFGVNAVIADAQCCDPLYRKAIRVSVGAALRVPFARLSPGCDMAEVMSRYGVVPFALTPAGKTELRALERPARAGILMGAEGPGLPQAVIAKSTSVSIAMAPGFDSLNVATASGIVLHHFAN